MNRNLRKLQISLLAAGFFMVLILPLGSTERNVNQRHQLPQQSPNGNPNLIHVEHATRICHEIADTNYANCLGRLIPSTLSGLACKASCNANATGRPTGFLAGCYQNCVPQSSQAGAMMCQQNREIEKKACMSR